MPKLSATNDAGFPASHLGIGDFLKDWAVEEREEFCRLAADLLDVLEPRLQIGRQVGGSAEVLSQQQISVFVRAMLAGTLQIAEADLRVRGYREGKKRVDSF